MILFFYNLALLVVLIAGAPWWLWRMATTDRYRDGLAQRLGGVPDAVLPLRTVIRSSGSTPYLWERCWQPAA